MNRASHANKPAIVGHIDEGFGVTSMKPLVSSLTVVRLIAKIVVKSSDDVENCVVDI